MQEIESINNYFLSLLSSETAKNTFYNRKYFSNKNDLIEDLALSQEVLNYCNKYPLVYFPEIADVREKLPLSQKDYILDTQDIFSCYCTLKQWRILKQLEIISTEFPRLSDFINEIHFDLSLSKIWDSAFDDDGNILDSASPELQRIRKMKKNLRSQIEKVLQQQLNANEDLAEKRIAFREDRYVLPIKSNAKNRQKGIVHGFSSSGLVTYIEPTEIISLNNDLLSVDSLEHKEILRLLKFWSQKISESLHDILIIIERCVSLEIYFAKYSMSHALSAQLGTLSEDHSIHLQKIYNPFLLIKKGKKNTTPITITLSDQNHGIIISGPNAGGKSAALKTIALCVDMFLKGLPIPAQEISLPFYKDILIEIGDSQNLDHDLSTFSGHLHNINTILQKATSETLILIDEIAHATDPLEGEALACSIIDKFIQKNYRFVITTHYKQVKLKSLEHPLIKSYAAGFDLETLSPLYTLFPDSIGESYALNIAKKIGLDIQIVDNALFFLNERKNQSDLILSQIEDYERKLRLKEQNLLQQEQLLEEAHHNIKQKESQLQELSNQIKQEGIAKVDKELNHCLRELSHIQKNLANKPKEQSEKLHHIKETIKQKKIDINNQIRKHKALISIGDQVFVASLNKDATIEEIYEDKVSIRIGIIKYSVKKSDIFESSHKKSAKKVNVKVASLDDIKHQIDVHGYTVDEALIEIDKYLYRALAGGLFEFTIIHGKGMGILQKAIHAHLKSIPEIKKFHFAAPQDGGSGKTHIYFN